VIEGSVAVGRGRPDRRLRAGRVRVELTGAEARYRAIVDNAADAILVTDEDGDIISFNPAAERLFGYSEEEIVGDNVRLLTPPREDGADPLVAFGSGGPQWVIGFRSGAVGLRKDGSTFPMELSVTEWRADGQHCYTGVIRDISERARAEQLQRLLLGELNHRVKNSLAAVQALVSHTLRNATDLEGARRALNGRLVALAKGHDILTRENWEGAELADVVSAAIDAHGQPERFTLSRLSGRLTPKVALAMSMALHELCTNAAKYGALSVEGGRVGISVCRSHGQLRIVWRESGGPPVSPPTRSGFGSRMIAGLARDLEGAATLSYEPAGLVCVITAPQTRSAR
jgi:PAS domain S-box-containing protein